MAKLLTDEERREIAERCEKAWDMIKALNAPRGSAGKREWMMSIPARPGYDPDLVIGDALADSGRLSEHAEALQSDMDMLRRSDERILRAKDERIRELEDDRANRRENWLQDFLDWRGVRGEPCGTCQGAGLRLYASTATWRGGIGGAAMTTDVCDQCWGSGSEDRQGANLRRLEGRHG